MPITRVIAFTSEEPATPSPYSNKYGTLEILQAIGAVLIVFLGSASVVMSLLSLSLCSYPVFFFFFTLLKNLVDSWLLVHGVTVLGGLVGLVVWRSKMSYGKIINGPKILAILLITINFLWLVWGNVLVALGFSNYSSFTIFGYYIFFVFIVLLFDVFYIIFFMTLCIFGAKGQEIVFLDDDVPSSDSCCVLPYCLTCLIPFPHRASWQEWVAVTCIAVYLMLGVGSIIIGSVYFFTCSGMNFLPVWNIVNGLLTLVTVGVLMCCFGFPSWIRLTWEKPSFVVFTPIAGLIVFLMVWLVVGNASVLRDPLAGCLADSTCNPGLFIYSAVAVYILDLIAFVLVYVAVVFLVLMMILSTITSCAQYCGKPFNKKSPSGSTSEVTVEDFESEREGVTTSG